MTFKIKKGGVWVDPTTVRRRQSGAWVTPQTIKRRVSGAWVTVWSALTVTKTSDATSAVFLAEPQPSNRSMTAYPTIVVTGSAAYTVSWTRLSASAGISISSTTTLNPGFSRSVPKNTEVAETWRCTVTDTASGQQQYVDVSVSLAYWTDL